MQNNSTPIPRLIVVMGVSGSGKSTLAHALAERCGFRYLEGDDYHSGVARSRMTSGASLNDELRAPWIHNICQHLQQLAKEGQNCVLAYSGLKKAYRDPLRATGFKVTFLFMDSDKATLQQRMANRKGHFMPPELLNSQCESLERPTHEPDVVRLDATLPLQEVIEQAANLLDKKQ